MESGEDRATMLRYWGKFAPKKGRMNKTNAMKYIYKILLENINELFGALPESYYDQFNKESKLKKAIEEAFASKNKPFLDKLYGIYKENIKKDQVRQIA